MHLRQGRKYTTQRILVRCLGESVLQTAVMPPYSDKATPTRTMRCRAASGLSCERNTNLILVSRPHENWDKLERHGCSSYSFLESGVIHLKTRARVALTFSSPHSRARGRGYFQERLVQSRKNVFPRTSGALYAFKPQYLEDPRL